MFFTYFSAASVNLLQSYLFSSLQQGHAQVFALEISTPLGSIFR